MWSGTLTDHGTTKGFTKITDTDGINDTLVTAFNGQTVTTPPVSGTAYGPYEIPLNIVASFSSTGSAGTVTPAISPDGITYTTLAPLSTPPTAGTTIPLSFRVPASFYYKFTFTNVTAGALIATT